MAAKRKLTKEELVKVLTTRDYLWRYRAAGLQEGGAIENYRSGRRGLFGWFAVWLDMLRGFIRQYYR